jgi:hypothetical protein
MFSFNVGGVAADGDVVMQDSDVDSVVVTPTGRFTTVSAVECLCSVCSVGVSHGDIFSSDDPTDPFRPRVLDLSIRRWFEHWGGESWRIEMNIFSTSVIEHKTVNMYQTAFGYGGFLDHPLLM